MGHLPTIEDLTELRDWYQERVLEHLGPEAIVMSISAQGARFILEELLAQDGSVLDMGVGFSTLCMAHIGRAAWGADHQQQWLDFVYGLFLEQKSVEPAAWATIEHAKQRWSDRRFGAIVVDHGPQLHTRADDLPWLATLLKPDGIFLFDDWRPKHEGRIRRALAKIEDGAWAIGAAEHTRRAPRDKAIGWARRK